MANADHISTALAALPHTTSLAFVPVLRDQRRGETNQYVTTLYSFVTYCIYDPHSVGLKVDRGRRGQAAHSQETMGASTIVVAREDLSIPGASGTREDSSATAVETHFFNVLKDYQPDVVVLDLRGADDRGVGAILKVRRRSTVPIVVVCGDDDPLAREYCLAGAAECMHAPVDITVLNQTVQQIIQISKGAVPASVAPEAGFFQAVSFAGFVLYPHENLLVTGAGASAKLTTSENRVLLHFVTNPWKLCTRDAIAEALYGPQRPSTDRAVDVIVTRLRKKIGELGGPDAQRLIKTEFRRGYVFVAEVSCEVPAARREADTRLRARTA